MVALTSAVIDYAPHQNRKTGFGAPSITYFSPHQNRKTGLGAPENAWFLSQKNQYRIIKN